MLKSAARVGRTFVPALALLLASCNLLGPELDDVGVIGFWEGEGGCWTLTTEAENFHPLDLPEEFRVVGLRVEFEAERRQDLLSPCPGEVIELLEIRVVG